MGRNALESYPKYLWVSNDSYNILLETINEVPIYKLMENNSGDSPDNIEDLKETYRMTTDRKKYVLSGKTQYFTPFKVDEFTDGEYTVTLSNLCDASQKLLDDLEIPYKDAKEEWPDKEDRHGWGKVLRMRSQFPIKTLDGAKEKWAEETLIGNGSEARVVFYAHNWQFKAKTGWRAVPTTCQIIDLVEYVGGNDADLLEAVPVKDGSGTPKKEAEKRTVKGKTVVVDDLNDDLSDILPD